MATMNMCRNARTTKLNPLRRIRTNSICGVTKWHKPTMSAIWKNIKDHAPYNIPVTITGVLGLWDGKHEICPVEMDSVYDAINKCYGRDISHIKAFYEDGVIRVLANHHDGTNDFIIKPTDGSRLKYLYAD